MTPELTGGRLKTVHCPACDRAVILEPGAREGDVILCPGCRTAVELVRMGEGPELVRWQEAPTRGREDLNSESRGV